MSRVTFYSLFDGTRGLLKFAFATTFSEQFGPLRDELGPSQEGGREQFQNGLRQFCSAAAENPAAAELCLVHCHEARAEAEGHDAEAAVEIIASLIESGSRATSRDGSVNLSPFMAEGLARMVVSLTAQHLQEGRSEELEAACEEMQVLIQGTYLP
jgi:hypothetical protein